MAASVKRTRKHIGLIRLVYFRDAPAKQDDFEIALQQKNPLEKEQEQGQQIGLHPQEDYKTDTYDTQCAGTAVPSSAY